MRLYVEGMSCGHCERAIQRAIGRLGGHARVDLAGRTVDIEGIEDAASVRAAIENEGYRIIAEPAATSSGGCCKS